MLDQAVILLEEMGLFRYEISAFARSEKYSCHNTGYWTGRPFLGLGPSAFSFWERERFSNCAHFHRYLEKLKNGDLPIDFKERLADEAHFKEMLAVQLRLKKGVELTAFKQSFGKMPEETERALKELIREGWLEREGEWIRLSTTGQLFYDSVAVALI